MNIGAYRDLTGFQLSETRDNWKSLCPAHLENTPSFYIHRETYLCHCFGCGVRGYLDTVLAKALEIPSRDVRKALDIPAISRFEKIEKQEVWFEEIWIAGFPRILTHPLLEARGFTSETITSFDTRWDSKDKRLVFPLRCSTDHQIVGAIGRSLLPDQDKWYTYWNALKGNLLYAPYLINGTLIIVEGIFDAMWLYQHGYRNAVALLGDHTSKIQENLIKESADEVILFLDCDKAGIICQTNLAKRLKSSLKVSIALYPRGRGDLDPQELTAKELENAIENRCSYVQYVASQ